MDPADVARETFLQDHESLLADVLTAADEVATSWSSPPTERAEVVGPFRAALDERSVPSRAVDALNDAADALGMGTGSRPVPAPPYVVVSSEGLVLRLTEPESGDRLVATVFAFDIERDGDTRYVRGPSEPAAALSVTFE